MPETPLDISFIANLHFQNGKNEEGSSSKTRSWYWKREARRLARRIADAWGTPPTDESNRGNEANGDRDFY